MCEGDLSSFKSFGMLGKRVPIGQAKNIIYMSTILDAFAGGHIQLIQQTWSDDKTLQRSVSVVFFNQEKYILKVINSLQSMTDEIIQARKEYQIGLENAKENSHIAKPLAIQEAIDPAADTISIETLYEHGGADLKTLMGKLNAQEIFAFIKKTLDPLVHLESKGIFHSDIKPENIVIKDGVVKLIDFGVAKDFERRTMLLKTMTSVQKQAVGFTMRYCPPEVFNRTCKANFGKIDVYCWGMTIYQLLTNKSDGELVNEQEAYKEPGQNYDDFLKIVAKVHLPGDADYSLTKLLVPTLLQILAFNPHDRPTFTSLRTFFGEPGDIEIIQGQLCNCIDVYYG